MNRHFLRCLPLLASMLGCLPAAAQILQADQAGERASPPAPVPCLRAYCGAMSTIAEPAATRVVLAPPGQQSWQRAGAREWDEQMGARRPGEDYNCLLSVGFGGQLASHGYRGVKLFGQTRTVSSASGGVAQ